MLAYILISGIRIWYLVLSHALMWQINRAPPNKKTVKQLNGLSIKSHQTHRCTYLFKYL